MKSFVVDPEGIEVADSGECSPHLALAFLPPRPDQEDRLAALRRRWPEALLVGCEAVTQFREGSLARNGCVQLFSWERSPAEPWVEVVGPGAGDLEAEGRRIADRIRGETAVFVLADGLRFPVQDLLAAVRERVAGPLAHVAGGLASQSEPVQGPGARVFLGEEILEGACLVGGLPRVEAEVRVVRGWDPASPVYRVTRAEGNVLREIDGEPATAWFERFFRLDDGMAPLPLSAYSFPLILEGPDPARQGLYRSMRFFDDPPGAVTFWGDFREGDRIRLGIGNGASLARAAAEIGKHGEVEAATLYSCVGRELVLGDAAEAEIRAVRSALGEISLAGFFTFGEVGPSAAGGLAFYNHTAILSLLREVG